MADVDQCLWPTAEEDNSKKKKERSKRARTSEGRSGSEDEPRKARSKINDGNDLGL
jgi:hypothetical protein